MSYSMFRYTSVVTTRIEAASRLMLTSPVSNPTRSAPNWAQKSLYFWLERALSGVVYSTRFPSADPRYTAASPHTVFPEPVGAETITFRFSTRAVSAPIWNSSSGKEKDAARSLAVIARSRRYFSRSAFTTAGVPASASSSGSAVVETFSTVAHSTVPSGLARIPGRPRLVAQPHTPARASESCERPPKAPGSNMRIPAGEMRPGLATETETCARALRRWDPPSSGANV
mmetsp:Transcript_67306/g.160579  ORF Transcript_67306/g.160579 Transcript_67306/m.160579 type:complete len:229 (-) Transcript_67306:126-812(-)